MSGGGGGFLSPVTDVLGEITGAGPGARAAGAAGRAALAQQQSDRALAMKYAEPSEMEMQQLEQAIALNSQDVARKEKLLASADPALIEAGNQALQLMQGKQAAALDPIKSERERGKQQLQNTLAQRLGPDYAQSSAGITALSEYDRQTGMLMNQAQQQTLSQFLGVAQNTAQMGSMQSNIGNAAALSQVRGNINQRQVGAVRGTPIDASLAYAGDIARARGQQQLFGQVMQIGGAAAGAYFGGLASGAAGSVGGKIAGQQLGSSFASNLGQGNYDMGTGDLSGIGR
jgi:hypothetical protein